MTQIHPRLLNDCLLLGRFSLCHFLLVNDTNYPWFILVPDRHEITEIYQLTESDQVLLLSESSMLSKKLMKIFNGDKLNIAALGNQVPQLHLHHIVRFHTDSAWPGPVWGKVSATAYNDIELDEMLVKLKQAQLIGN